MKLPDDKLQHLKWGLGLAVLIGATLLVSKASDALALALACAALGVGVEVYQKARNEGRPSWLDAAFTAAPGLLLALVVWLALKG